MNLLLRLMWIVLRARFAARHTPLTAPIRRRFRVWLTDQDMFLHMTNSRYLSFSDLGRVDLFTRSGLNRLLRQKGWRTSISAQTMTINRMLKTPNAFELETRVHGWNDQFLVVEQTFLRKGRNHATVATLLEIQDETGGSVAPQTLAGLFSPKLESPHLPKALIDLINSTRKSRQPEE